MANTHLDPRRELPRNPIWRDFGEGGRGALAAGTWSVWRDHGWLSSEEFEARPGALAPQLEWGSTGGTHDAVLPQSLNQTAATQG
jgi:hypothetical protein